MLDALGRRLRFAPPQPKPGFIKITERDVLAFEAINRHGPLPVHYLYEFTRKAGKNLACLKKKLTKLNHGTTNDAPYLFRPDQQWASLDGKFQPNIYDLTPRALAVLAERGTRLANRADPFLHRFMGACVNASIQLAAEKKGYTYADLARLLAHEKCPEAARRSPNPLAMPATGKYVIPDAIFGVQKDKPFFYAVEIDRRTESIASDTAKTAYGRKLHGYLDILENKTYRAHLGIPNLKILTVTTNPLHLQHMLNFYRTLNAPIYAQHFLFKAIPNFGANWRVPPVMYDLFNSPWIAADGSQQPIG
jgi:Replication-relaxation